MILTKPTSIHGSITERCQLKCRNCDWWRQRNDRPEARLEDWLAFIGRLRDWLGPFDIHFAGGEPFLKTELLDLIRGCADRQVRAFVTTNGALITGHTAADLAGSGLWCLNVSLDFTGRDRQDWLKGVPGTADRIHAALEHIDRTRGDRYHVAIATVIMKQNLRDIPRLVEFARERGYYIGFQVVFQNFAAPYDPHWYEKSEFWPDDPALVDETMDYLLEQKTKDQVISNQPAQLAMMKRYFNQPQSAADFTCTVGDKMLTFNPYGDLALCFNTPPVGTIYRDNIRLVWYGLKAQRRRRLIRRCKRQCAMLNCHFED